MDRGGFVYYTSSHILHYIIAPRLTLESLSQLEWAIEEDDVGVVEGVWAALEHPNVRSGHLGMPLHVWKEFIVERVVGRAIRKDGGRVFDWLLEKRIPDGVNCRWMMLLVSARAGRMGIVDKLLDRKRRSDLAIKRPIVYGMAVWRCVRKRVERKMVQQVVRQLPLPEEVGRLIKAFIVQ